MRYAIIYWSRFGNGKRCVEHLARRMEEGGAQVDVLRTVEADPKAMPEADVYIFSAPTEAFRVQSEMKAFMMGMVGMEGKRYALINTHGMKKGKLGSMEKLLTGRKGMVHVSGIDFHVDTKRSSTGDGLPAGWEARLDEFAGKL